jgi:hypothetical protein
MSLTVYTVIGFTDGDFDCLMDDLTMEDALLVRTVTAWTEKDALAQMVDEVRLEFLADEDVTAVKVGLWTDEKVHYYVTLKNGNQYEPYLQFEVRPFILPDRVELPSK